MERGGEEGASNMVGSELAAGSHASASGGTVPTRVFVGARCVHSGDTWGHSARPPDEKQGAGPKAEDDAGSVEADIYRGIYVISYLSLVRVPGPTIAFFELFAVVVHILWPSTCRQAGAGLQCFCF